MIEIVGVVFLWTMVSIIVFCIALRFFMCGGCRKPDILVKEVVIKDGDMPAFYDETQGCTCFYCFWYEKCALHDKDCVLPCSQRDFYKFDDDHFELNQKLKSLLDYNKEASSLWRCAVFYTNGKRYVAFDSPKSESIEAFYCPKKN